MKMISEATGLRFICIARVTESNWTTCAVLDLVDYNLAPGDELAIQTTYCQHVRKSSTPIIIDSVKHDENYRDSPIPKMYKFESYFSYPIYGRNGEFFGTLCGLDPEPADLKNTQIKSQILAFANLLSRQLMDQERFDQVQTALSDEKSAARLREQYIAILGHDIRTPLSSFSLSVDLLKDHLNDEFSKKILRKMTNSVGRMKALINNVMDFTQGRVGGGITIYPHTVENLEALIEHAVSELTDLNKSCRIDCDIHLPSPVKCDPHRICQLLSNLLINAITHGDTSSPILVCAYERNGQFLIEVTNEGSEIPREIQQRLFQPFWRCEQNKESKGLGLGLFIASEIAKAHSGDLSVLSENSKTTFTFRMKVS
nr:HAMP domain-containing sensor histidine kinase [Alteromonas sp. ASW11-130]